jgi:hypothetical protein
VIRLRCLACVAAVFLAAACNADPKPSTDGAGAVRVHVTFTDPLRAHHAVTWTVTVTNRGAHRVELRFATGQRADVRLERDGRVFYRWSRGQLFSQVMGRQSIEPGARASYRLETTSLDVDPGAYTLVGVVTTSNRDDLREAREVTVRSA